MVVVVEHKVLIFYPLYMKKMLKKQIFYTLIKLPDRCMPYSETKLSFGVIAGL